MQKVSDIRPVLLRVYDAKATTYLAGVLQVFINFAVVVDFQRQACFVDELLHTQSVGHLRKLSTHLVWSSG